MIQSQGQYCTHPATHMQNISPQLQRESSFHMVITLEGGHRRAHRYPTHPPLPGGARRCASWPTLGGKLDVGCFVGCRVANLWIRHVICDFEGTNPIKPAEGGLKVGGCSGTSTGPPAT